MGSAPILQVRQQFQSQSVAPMSSDNVTNMSPISPALMCTNEVLMLPSAGQGFDNRTQFGHNDNIMSQSTGAGIGIHSQKWHNQASTFNNNNNNVATHPANLNPPSTAQINTQMQLPAWLQHMNNVATLASQAGSPASKQMPVSQGHGMSYVSNHTGLNMNANMGGSNRHVYQHMEGAQPMFPVADILPIPSSVTPMAHSIFYHDDQAVESKEKRQKRLARNRESARQSRRRKKELLLNLRNQVSRLHSDIEYIRKGKMETMEHDMMVDKLRILNELFLDQKCNGQSVSGVETFVSVVRNSVPNIAERKAAIEFQYKALRKAILPHYRQLILALSLKDRSFFIDAKEQKIKTQKTTGRVSSKQVGEDISKSQADKDSKDDSGGKGNLSCSGNDKSLFWPLLCYELSIGIDQEEKLLQAFDHLRLNHEVEESRRKIASSVSVVSSLQQSLLVHCNSVANQNKTALLQILTPNQAIRFLDWFLRNRDRCARMIDKPDTHSTISAPLCNMQLNDNQLPKANSDQIGRAHV